MKSLTKTKKSLNKRKKKGFTLIELIIVVAIIGILSAIAIPRFGNAQKNAKIKADIANAKIIANAAIMKYAKDGEEVSEPKEASITNLGEYLQSVPKVQYKKDGKNKNFYYKVDDKGKVTVYVAENENNASDDTEIYPEQKQDYKSKKSK